ncbi:MAG: ammonium transporter [Candidatus Methanoliparum thermophilum]|uniref:Ammonium transporter n=1 Tax=Methanoliparum thermophilum TaxID=2491083 RepID=A0A520KS79_METT2|nr:ammonium transporter [Candidatus Methanoliparum sp. LAM-1]RZN64629.1 MAG: ammonium transporter [Candidatus Methanoliparum thermophilum]BDC35746.1 ammonium transporter [Candidatus Methanoliparum sp. LAM-1]
MRVVKIRRGTSAIYALVLLSMILALVPCAMAGDPTGARTLKENPEAPVNYIWILVCGFLVMFMQAGFAMVETGFCRAKNATNLMAKNLMDLVIGSLCFMAVGFAIMMGADMAGLIGTTGWFLYGEYDVSRYLTFFWQLVFCATAASIVSGAVAERLKIPAYLICSAVVSLLIYPIFGHWVWGGGWLSTLPFGMGHLDFAGSGVVHTVGGMVGLAGTIVLGPRFGKFVNGKPRAIPGHSITLAALGVFILWFGWLGFNCGSTFSADQLRIAVIAVNTTLSAAAGAFASLMVIFLKTRKWDVGIALNGVLAGLVAITAPCAWVEAWAAVVIGLVAGVLVVASVYFLESRGVDDPVGAVSVHGTNGLWGLISVGLFADGTYGYYTTGGAHAIGLLYGGGAGQLIAQVIGACTVVLWAFGLGYLLFKAMDAAFGIRVSPEEELQGLDISEHGTPAYPDFYIKNGGGG